MLGTETRSMEYHCISADSHIDLNYLPRDLFVAYA